VEAHKLIVSLEKQGGIHALLFCIRGGRISSTVQQNYRLFYEFLCHQKVPLALIFTGLENEPVDMDNWWKNNKAQVELSGIASFRQVCITTIMGYNNACEERYLESRRKMHDLLNELGRVPAHSVEVSSWFARMCKKLREFLVPVKLPWLKSLSRENLMKQMLMTRCNLSKEDAVQLLQRISDDKRIDERN